MYARLPIVRVAWNVQCPECKLLQAEHLIIAIQIDSNSETIHDVIYSIIQL